METSTARTHQSPEPAPLIRTTSSLVESAAVAARFLDSYGVTARTLHVTELGRVELMVDAAGFSRVTAALVVDHGASQHVEGGFLFLEGRVEGVPVQVWVPVEERDAWLSAQVEASNTRQDARLRSVGGAL